MTPFLETVGYTAGVGGSSGVRHGDGGGGVSKVLKWRPICSFGTVARPQSQQWWSCPIWIFAPDARVDVLLGTPTEPETFLSERETSNKTFLFQIIKKCFYWKVKLPANFPFPNYQYNTTLASDAVFSWVINQCWPLFFIDVNSLSLVVITVVIDVT